MKKVMALFAALILLVGCTAAQVEGFRVRFDETWFSAYFLGEKCVWVLDRDGKLMRWAYDDAAPEQVGNLPVTTREMFENYTKLYSELPASNRSQIDETVTILAEDEGTLYALNHYSGKIGIVANSGLQWNGRFDASPFHLDNGENASKNGALVMNHKLYVLLDCVGQATNLILEIDLKSGQTRKKEEEIMKSNFQKKVDDELLAITWTEENKNSVCKRIGNQSTGRLTGKYLFIAIVFIILLSILAYFIMKWAVSNHY